MVWRCDVSAIRPRYFEHYKNRIQLHGCNVPKPPLGLLVYPSDIGNIDSSFVGDSVRAGGNLPYAKRQVVKKLRF